MSRDLIFLRRIVGFVALLFLLIGGYAGNAKAQFRQPWPQGGCPDTTQTGCTKEIRVYNNTGDNGSPPKTIYVVWQGSIQRQPAINCAQGDVWLQNALNVTDGSKCFVINNTYLAFINPTSGIKPGEFVSIQIPWWSKNTDTSSGADQYIDWWRASRIYIFDDQIALNDSYLNPGKTQASLVAPVISCTTGGIAGNKCVPNELSIYKVPSGSSANIGDPTPFQLNEFTFADIPGLTPCNQQSTPTQGCSLNVNFNVSYVDHVYLPVAIGPIRAGNFTPSIGFMGSATDVATFQNSLKTFTGCSSVPCTAPTNWPVFNNPLISGKPKYPKAGIKLPSTLNAFGYYMNPGLDPQGNPILLPSSSNPGKWPTPAPTLLQQAANNWSYLCAPYPPLAPESACGNLANGTPNSALYQPALDAFLQNYQTYLNKCGAPPDYLKRLGAILPARPQNQFTLLRFLHGWVPFESEGCPLTPLPLPSDGPSQCKFVKNSPTQYCGGIAVLDYKAMQYNWQQVPPDDPEKWFNAYTRLIHGTLKANAYAFSIDDEASLMNVAATGLILGVGGTEGLENTTQFAPPLVNYSPWYTFSVALGAGGLGWKSYSLCGGPELDFQTPLQSPGSPPSWGMNPASYTFPCTIKLTGNNTKLYQFTIQKAAIPQKAIWPLHPTGPFDPAQGVISCDDPGSEAWCKGINEIATPGTDFPTNQPQYSLLPPGPI